MDEHAVTALPLDRHAPAAARRLVRATLAAWGLAGDVVEDAQLVATELVTNAVLHARVGDAVRLELRRSAGSLRVAVADGTAVLPEVRAASASAESGRYTGRARPAPGTVPAARAPRRHGQVAQSVRASA